MANPDPDTVERYETAAAWFTRRGTGEGWSAEDEASWQAWLDADPRHRQAYDAMAATWTDLDHLPRPRLANDVAMGEPNLRRPPLRARRAWVMTSLAACLAAVVGAGYGYLHVPTFSDEVSTLHAPLRDVILPDRTVVSLNAGTHLQVRFYPRHREVRLIQGEAFFDVASHEGQPFAVKAHGVDVNVVGTAFNVRLGERAVHVRVQEGTVRVDAAGVARPAAAVLTAGQGVEVDRATSSVRQLTQAPEAVGSWRAGHLVFRHATLAEVVEELAAYLDRPVRLIGAGTAGLRLSGIASTGEPRRFIDALPALLPVAVTQQPDGSYRVSAR